MTGSRPALPTLVAARLTGFGCCSAGRHRHCGLVDRTDRFRATSSWHPRPAVHGQTVWMPHATLPPGMQRDHIDWGGPGTRPRPAIHLSEPSIVCPVMADAAARASLTALLTGNGIGSLSQPVDHHASEPSQAGLRCCAPVNGSTRHYADGIGGPRANPGRPVTPLPPARWAERIASGPRSRINVRPQTRRELGRQGIARHWPLCSFITASPLCTLLAEADDGLFLMRCCWTNHLCQRAQRVSTTGASTHCACFQLEATARQDGGSWTCLSVPPESDTWTQR